MEHLSDVDKRRDYDKRYESIILPGKLEKIREIEKDREIANLTKQLHQFKNQRGEPESLLHNARKDLVRLRAEMDSLKGERERIMREKTTEETWWLYICSFMPGKAVEFTRQRQRRGGVMANLIGKQYTKAFNIQDQEAKIQNLEQKIQTFSKNENKIKEEMTRIEEEWIMTLVLAERRRQREQASRDRPTTQTYFTRENGYRHQHDTWEF